jgi:hypothetical protein
MMAGLLCALPVHAQYWRERAYSNPFTAGYKAFNPYVGGYGDVTTVGYNPYTGLGSRAGSDPGTGPFGKPSTSSDAATGTKAASTGGDSPNTKDAYRDKVGYNPYTGNEYVAGRAYGARTGQRTLYGATYNPMTGNGR